jgi:hypothetical protein
MSASPEDGIAGIQADLADRIIPLIDAKPPLPRAMSPKPVAVSLIFSRNFRTKKTRSGLFQKLAGWIRSKP